MNSPKNSQGGAQIEPPIRRRGSARSISDYAQYAILGSSLILAPAAMFALGEESGPVATIKYLTVGLMAAGASFAVVRLSLTKLAASHALGDVLAGAAAILGISLAGSALTVSSVTGLTYASVEAKVYQAAGQELADFIGDANEVTLIAERIAPAVETLGAKIDATIECEIAESCLSLNPLRGRGPTTRALEGFSTSALSIAQELQAGERDRSQNLEELNDLSAHYFDVLGDKSRSLADRRAELQVVFGEVKQSVAALLETTPTHLFQGFVDELQAGATVAGNPTASRAVTSYLGELGIGLEKQLSDLPEVDLVAPHMPDRPGMLDVIRHVPDFLAFGIIVMIGDLLLPLMLYLMTFSVLRRQARNMFGEEVEDLPPHPFTGLVAPELLERPYRRGDVQ